MTARLSFRMTRTRVVLILLALGTVALGVYRFGWGLGAATNLNDDWPWGMWIGFDVMSGVALAAGAFTMAAIVHIFHLEQFKPLLRPAILTGFLGYLLVVGGLMFDLGRPWNIWHPMVFWQPHSVMFEVAWCVMIYTTVLTLEFAPVLFEKSKYQQLWKRLRSFALPLVVLGILLSTLHQSSLGSLFLLVPYKMHPLWYSPLLPVHFFLSAVTVGMAMVVVEACISTKAYCKKPEIDLLSKLAKGLPYALTVVLAVRLADLAYRGALSTLTEPRLETYMFLAEIVLGILVPLTILSQKSLRQKPNWLFGGSALVVMGVVLNRFNVSLTGMSASLAGTYLPSWMEVGISAGIVAVGVLIYLFIVENFPVFHEDVEAWQATKAQSRVRESGPMRPKEAPASR